MDILRRSLEQLTTPGIKTKPRACSDALDPARSYVRRGPIAGLFVARDTLNFTILQTMIVLLLIIGVLIVVAVWPRTRGGSR